MDRIMENNSFFIWIEICVTTHIIRFVYEILKHKRILTPNKLTFVIVFANMGFLWVSWFELCGADPYRMSLPGIVQYMGIAFVVIGIILFLTALFTIKSLENYEGDLMTEGIYSKIRHPMYLGFILWLLGFPMIYGALSALVLSVVFIANILFWKHLEEKELEERFSSYRDYKTKTIF
jgi:protein-S-isoprenylcysteine O-methyltransferase Ste14